MSKEAAKVQAQALVDRYSQLSPADRKKFKEAATRQEFILPLFEALGWDIRNTREVAPEENVSKGFVDFAFRLHGIPQFFLETKRIGENMNRPDAAKQAINYAWLKGVTWAVLSDFEQTKIFNAEWQVENPIFAVFKDFKWDEYVTRFDELWLLSKESVDAGVMNQLAESVGRKVKKTPVDRKLFEDLIGWRQELFPYVQQYTNWSVEQVDEAVQRILNRLIFIRTVEDRQIEEKRLQPLARELRDRRKINTLPAELTKLFRELDKVYNARLFAEHFSEQIEKVEATPFENIIAQLYEIKGGYGFYDFSAINADVLGTIYEQYLGYVALDPTAKVSAVKNGKRKKHGIFYTPRFVVKYIVQQTLGKMLEEGGLELALKIKVLDPACGSGSFLIEAFDVLDHFIASAQGQAIGADSHADAERRKRILAHNIYGVDLDSQAVEITKLNLWLRATSSREKLPHLDNIRHGNSLIDDATITGDSAFNWQEEFDEVMGMGGFDVIIGNPPYIRIQTVAAEEVKWFAQNYLSATGNYDLYALFVERALNLVSAQAKIGYIIPCKFLTTDYGLGLRKLLADKEALSKIVDFGHGQVFEEATTYTCILFLDGAKAPTSTYYLAQKWLENSRNGNGNGNGLDEKELEAIPIPKLSEKAWVFTKADASHLLEKLNKDSTLLIELPVDISRGSSSGADPVFMLEQSKANLYDKQGKLVDIEAEILRTPIFAPNLGRFHFQADAKTRIIFPYVLAESGKYRLIDENTLKTQYPKAYDYLAQYRPELEARKQWKTWYSYSAARNLNLHDKAQFLVPLLANKGLFCPMPLEAEKYCLMASGGFSITLGKTDLHPHYILGLLNSKLLFWKLTTISNVFRDGWVTCTKQYTSQLPIHQINFAVNTEKDYHDQIVIKVEKIMTLQADLAVAEAQKLDKRHDLAKKIAKLDAEIDELAYQLYGLTAEEIRLVEDSLKA